MQEIPVTHGSYFYYAHKEGLLAANNSNIVCLASVLPKVDVNLRQHVGIRNALWDWQDEIDDYNFGWIISYAEDIEEVGWKGIVKRIRKVVGDNPVYSKFSIVQTFHLSANDMRDSHAGY